MFFSPFQLYYCDLYLKKLRLKNVKNNEDFQ